MAEARLGYERAWAEIDDLAATALEAVDEAGVLDLRLGDRRWFEVLEEHLSARGDASHTLLVVDATGFPAAWAGAGLLHPVEEGALPKSGRRYRTSFAAVTLFSVYPLEEEKRPRRLIIGRSFDRDTYPWGSSSVLGSHAWAVRRADPDLEGSSQADLAIPITVPETPTLWVSKVVRVDTSQGVGYGYGLRWGAALFALVLFFGVGQRFSRSDFGSADLVTKALFSVGLGALALALGSPLWAAGALAVALLFTLVVLARPASARSAWHAAAFSTLASLVVLWVIVRLPASLHLLPLSRDILNLSPEGWALRGALGGLFATLLAAFRAPRARGIAEFGLRGGILLLLVAGLLTSVPMWGVPVLALAVFACALGLANDSRRQTLRWVGAWCVVSALASAVAWQLVEFHREEREWSAEVLPRLIEAPVAPLEALVESTRAAFDGADVSDLFVGDPSGVGRDDLAYALWRRSSLAVEGTLSALAVTANDRLVSSFSFGLPVDDEGNLDRSSERWDAVESLVFLDALDGSEVELHLYGHPWARVRYWVAVLPTFQGTDERLGDLAPGLLRGGPAETTDPANLLPGSGLVLYGDDGTVLSSRGRNHRANQRSSATSRVPRSTTKSRLRAVRREPTLGVNLEGLRRCSCRRLSARPGPRTGRYSDRRCTTDTLPDRRPLAGVGDSVARARRGCTGSAPLLSATPPRGLHRTPPRPGVDSQRRPAADREPAPRE